MELFYSSGLRLDELVGLDLTSSTSPIARCACSARDRKTRIVPVGRKAVDALRAWLRERGALAGRDETAVFVGKNGSRLKHRAIQLRIALLGAAQGPAGARLSAPVPAFVRHASA